MTGISLRYPLFLNSSIAGSSNSNGGGRLESSKNLANKKVLILGGTGRVGSSTARALQNFCPSLHLLVAGRNMEKGRSVVSTLGKHAEFLELDIDDIASMEDAFDGVDLVVHAAGPFQRAKKCNVLDAAITTKTRYVDVCDDANYAWQAKSFHDSAVAAGVPALITAGICPGISNVMAAELVRILRSDTCNGGEPTKLRFFYFTAGTGGAGPTILATSFLLLGEDVIAYNQGEEIKLKPYTGKMNVDFGEGIGKRDVYLLNLPEVSSTHKILRVPSVSARFGTAPNIWNRGMIFLQNHLPNETFQDRSKVQKLVQIFNPIVRATDAICGERISMRLELECSKGTHTLGLFSHERLSVSMGVCVATFALTVLEGCSQPGVWFNEEEGGIPIEKRELLLQRASQGTFNFVMNKPSWMVEAVPKEPDFGMECLKN